MRPGQLSHPQATRPLGTLCPDVIRSVKSPPFEAAFSLGKKGPRSGNPPAVQSLRPHVLRQPFTVSSCLFQRTAGPSSTRSTSCRVTRRGGKRAPGRRRWTSGPASTRRCTRRTSTSTIGTTREPPPSGARVGPRNHTPAGSQPPGPLPTDASGHLDTGVHLPPHCLLGLNQVLGEALSPQS